MLKTYLNATPSLKFILITDSIDNKATDLFNYILKPHVNQNVSYKTHYCVFEGVFKRAEAKFQDYPNIVLHNFVKDVEKEAENDSFLELALRLGNNAVIVVDSLAHAVLRYGLPAVYRVFNYFKNNKGLKQIITILHKDLIEGDAQKITQYFNNLTTLTISIESTFLPSDNPRLQYDYKKKGGKIIAEIEEYRFEKDHLITSKLLKLDPRKLLEKATPREVNPEELSTFKIGLTEQEKLFRDKIVLPYLPEANEPKLQDGGGKIIYEYDAVDDWDEEDPDDDLDI